MSAVASDVVTDPELEVVDGPLDGSVDDAPSVTEPDENQDQPGRGPVTSGGSTLIVTGSAICILAALLLGLVAELTVVGALRYERDQQTNYSELRFDLANGTAPTGQTDVDGLLLEPGSPVAIIKIPALGVDDVVLTGTTSAILMSGPGHRRDSVLPGQPGTSVVFGRQAAYSGPFGGIGDLAPGARIEVTTGQGDQTFEVISVRRPGDPQPPALEQGQSRLTLVSAAGTPYVPNTTVRVDADLVSDAVDAPARVLAANALSAAERPMAGDPTAWISVVFWAQGLVLAAVAAVWAAGRWGRWQSWVVAVPVLAFLGGGLAEQLARLLPNLI